MTYRVQSILSLLVVAMILAGCPAGDPATQSLIRNDTDNAVWINVQLDTEQWNRGFEPAEFDAWLAERDTEWLEGELQDFANNAGATLLGSDLENFAGTFQLNSSAVLVVNDSLGNGPFIDLTEIQISTTESSDPYVSITGTDAIERLFVEGDENLWQFDVSSAG